MQRSLKVAVALNLSVGALANYCLAGQKHKDNLAGLKCIMGTEDAVSCHTECCEPDPKKCGGRNPVPSCPSDSYFGSDFASRHTSVPTGTAKEANKVCCKKKATCSAATCPAGYKIKNSAMFCSGGADSCAQNLCCEPDTKTCGGAYADAYATAYAASIKGGGDATAAAAAAATATAAAAPNYIPATEAQRKKDNWNTKAVTSAAAGGWKTDCQLKMAHTCKDTSAYTCPAGLTNPGANAAEFEQLKTASAAGAEPKDATKCPSDAASCVSACCIRNVKTCGGLVLKTAGGATYFQGALTEITCDAKTFTPSVAAPKDLGAWDTDKVKDQKAYASAWANRPATAGKEVKDCCIARPTCSSHTCPAGQKKKTGLAKTELCKTTESCATDCCQDDATTCGGLEKLHGIKCKYGFYNEMDGWTSKTTQATKDAFNGKNATLALKDTACCTPRAPCAIPGTSTPAPNAVTTTPAAVVTTTPAAAALKFSEHKIATEASQSTGSNMLWLGVGALVGMGVLMVVQGLRSKTQARDQQINAEDADALLDSTVE